MKKIIIICLFILLFLISLSFLLSDTKEKVKVASCPTFYYMIEKLENIDWVEIVKTSSTAESLKLYEEGVVDAVISGRPLKENEPDLISEKISKGYDFIYQEEFNMWEEEMELISFYTNLPFEEIIADFKYITEDNLIKIEGDVADYIKEGVVITSLDGYLIGGTAQIYKSDFRRVRLTRLPRIHYSKNIDQNKLKIIKDTIRET